MRQHVYAEYDVIASTSKCENSKEILEKETQTGEKEWNRDVNSREISILRARCVT